MKKINVSNKSLLEVTEIIQELKKKYTLKQISKILYFN